MADQLEVFETGCSMLGPSLMANPEIWGPLADEDRYIRVQSRLTPWLVEARIDSAGGDLWGVCDWKSRTGKTYRYETVVVVVTN